MLFIPNQKGLIECKRLYPKLFDDFKIGQSIQLPSEIEQKIKSLNLGVFKEEKSQVPTKEEKNIPTKEDKRKFKNK